MMRLSGQKYFKNDHGQILVGSLYLRVEKEPEKDYLEEGNTEK